MITENKEKTLRLLSYDVIKVVDRDASGGYLLNRIKKVKEFISSNDNVYNPNQYQNEDNYLSYYYTLGNEICMRFPRLDYAFICVSSGGTITGISKRLKEKYQNIKVYAVDVDGSLIFQNIPRERSISGIGSSIKSELIKNAFIDEVIILNELQIVRGCHDLVNEQVLFCGGSTGAAYSAAKSVLNMIKHPLGFKPNALIICPDKGDSYLNTIYNNEWVENVLNKKQFSNEIP
jgi:cysteine synthase A